MDYLLEGLNQGNLIITSVVMLVLVIASTKARFLDTGWSCGCCICRAVSRATRTLDLALDFACFLGVLPFCDKMEV